MAVKKPACFYGGQLKELQAGDSVEGASSGSGVPTGGVIRSGKTNTPEGFFYCDGSMLQKATYPGLYAAIGTDFNYLASQYATGIPWQQQYLLNATDPGGLTWSTDTVFPEAFYLHRALVTKNRVYVFGNYSNANVYSAPIDNYGVIGTWQLEANTLPVKLYGSSVIATKSRIYMLGGNNGSAVATVYYSEIAADGTLGVWSAGTSLPEVCYYSQAVVIKGYAYLLGIYNGTTSYNRVYRAPINADGSLGAWASAAALPAAQRQHQILLTKDRIYLIGGYVATYSSQVWSAPINSDGTIGTWVAGTAFPTAITQASVVVTNKRAYMLGGAPTATSSAIVYSAPIDADGFIGAWSTQNSLPQALRNSVAVVTSSRIYMICGFNAAAVTSVYYSTFTGGKNEYTVSTYSESDFNTGFLIPDYRGVDARDTLSNSRHYIKY